MKPETLREEFESLVEQCGYEIRKERGAFRGSHCIIEGDKIVMINKSRPIDVHLGIYARLLSRLDLETVYVKPRVRKKLEEWWDQLGISATEVEEQEEGE